MKRFGYSGLDFLRLAAGSVLAHRLRSALTILGIVIGIASVILLTSLGEGTRRYLVSEFSQFGTNVMAVHRGKTTTSGVPGAMLSTVRKLTIEDSEALERVAGVRKVVPVAIGSARVASGERSRSVFIYGVTSEVPEVWKFRVRQGTFLPPGDAGRRAPLAVLGPKLKTEIFGGANALGRHVRIGGSRFLVIGVMEPKGQLLGFDMDDCAYIPVASAMSLFNLDELVEIDLTFSPTMPVAQVKAGIRKVLMGRHGGEEDFTMTTQTEMLDVLGRVLGVVSLAVGGIGAISLLVGAIGILTMMWISVGERIPEIGLAMAVGAGRGQIVRLFLLEAAMLSLAGGIAGVAAGLAVGALARRLVPGLPFHTPAGYVAAALAVSLAVGLASGVLPARRAAGLDPLEALRAE
jgi:putative ABC transport system permease protein